MNAVAAVGASETGSISSAWDAVAQMRVGHGSKADAAAVAAAKQALAAANSQVDQDKRDSPGCVADDEKAVKAAQLKLAQADAQAQQDQDQAGQSGGSPGAVSSSPASGGLDITA